MTSLMMKVVPVSLTLIPSPGRRGKRRESAMPTFTLTSRLRGIWSGLQGPEGLVKVGQVRHGQAQTGVQLPQLAAPVFQHGAPGLR